jgi:DNA-directed RNA polymerase specialized sigma24 family protein
LPVCSCGHQGLSRHVDIHAFQAIELMKLREMSLKEAAAATGTSIGALKVSVHRGISALRKALGAAN